MGIDDEEEDSVATGRNWKQPAKPIQDNHVKEALHSTPQLVLVTLSLPLTQVAYTNGLNENDKSGKAQPKLKANTVQNLSVLDSHQLSVLQPMENTSYSILQYNPSFFKDIASEGNEGVVRKCNEESSQQLPMILLKSQICETNGKNSYMSFGKTDSADPFLNSNVVIAPLPETVVDANLTNEVSVKEPSNIPSIPHLPINSNDEPQTIEEGPVKEAGPLMEQVVVKLEEGLNELGKGATQIGNVEDILVEGTEENQETLEEIGGWESDSSLEGGVKRVISDKPVACRARASLPATFLYIAKVSNEEDTVGVFARKEIPKRTQFGPVEGVFLPYEESQQQNGFAFNFTLTTSEGKFQRIDVSNEHLSNWMRYVRPGGGDENLALSEFEGALYFTSTRIIHPGQELRVWYSQSYALARSLPLSFEWSCSECKKVFKSSGEVGNYWSEEQDHKKVCTRKSNWKVRLRNSDEPNKTVPKERPTNILNENQKEDGKENAKDKKWCCSHCQRCFSTATLLNLHMLTHAADNLETFDSPSALDSDNEQNFDYAEDDNENQIEQENKPVHSCNICSKQFCTTSALACHLKSHSDGKKFECPICNKTFERVLGLKSHIRSHSLNGSFACSYCSKKFMEYKHIRKHIRTFHSGRNHTCVACSKRFPTMDKLRIHELSHSDHRQFLCANCGKQFKRKDKLSEHMKKIHYPDKEKPRPPPRTRHPKKFIPKMLGNINDFSQFVYKCHVCMVGFKRRGMLVNHLANRHPDIAPESVPELNLPILKATKDYYCQYCEKIYKSSSKRKAHILKNHPGAQLPSNNKRTVEENVNSGSYSQTVGSITTDPQGCSWCHKQYASKAKLLQHQRSKHSHLLPKPLQKPKRSGVNEIRCTGDEIEQLKCDNVGKVTENNILLQDPMGTDISEYEITDVDSHCFTEGEFIIDAPTLKRALRGEISAECLPESIAELGQLIADSRPEQYFKVIQTSSGISFAQPVEIWDPLASLSPSEEIDASPFLAPPYSAR